MGPSAVAIHHAWEKKQFKIKRCFKQPAKIGIFVLEFPESVVGLYVIVVGSYVIVSISMCAINRWKPS